LVTDTTSAAADARARRLYRLMMVPCLAFIVVVLVYPVSQLLSLGFHNAAGFTLAYYARFFGSPVYLEVLWITVKWSAVVTAICLLLGYPVAYLLTSVSSRTASLVMLLLAIALAMSLLVRTYAWMVILGQQGIVNSTLIWLGVISRPLNLLHNSFAVVVVMVQVLVPFMILTLAGVMRDIDKTLVVAARTLGANPVRAFFEVFVPLSLPGIGSGCLLVFVMSCGYFVIPALLGGPRDMWMSMLIETQVNNVVDWGFAAALAGILLVLVMAIFYVYERYWGLDRIWGGV
jgi:ABC-type spermidine/putrescine transport system permease subunit I